MDRAKLICLLLLGALALPSAVLHEAHARGPVAAGEQRPQPSGDAERQPAQNAARPAPTQPATRGGERRRNNYAFCNRESHKRNLHGGPRRRFLIRCKLGVERRQPSRPNDTSPTGRRP